MTKKMTRKLYANCKKKSKAYQSISISRKQKYSQTGNVDKA